MIIVLVILSILAWLVISHGSTRDENRAFFASAIMLGCWLAAVYGLQTEMGTNVAFARMVFALGILSILSLLQFVGFMVLRRDRAMILLGGGSVPWCISNHLIDVRNYCHSRADGRRCRAVARSSVWIHDIDICHLARTGSGWHRSSYYQRYSK